MPCFILENKASEKKKCFTSIYISTRGNIKLMLYGKSKWLFILRNIWFKHINCHFYTRTHIYKSEVKFLIEVTHQKFVAVHHII